METDINQTTTTALDTGVDDYQVDREKIDDAEVKELEWTNPDWSEYLGYYKNIPEFKEAIRALARWTVGKGYEPEDNRTKIILENITGWGEDSFQQILTNMIIVKKVNGDAYAEIIRNDKGTLVNLKPLNPGRMRHIVNSKGFIIRYEEVDAKKKKTKRTFTPDQIFHLCNDRIASEIHGTSAVEAVKWVINARNEAMSDWRRISHRSTVRVMYVDADDSDKLTQVKDQYKEAINNGEVMLIPAKKGEAEFVDYNLPPIDAFIRWIQYLEGFFYQALGVPKAIANTADFTEAASKVGYMTFEPVYTEEQTLLEQDLWNQLAVRIKFNRPPSLAGTLQEDETKNTGQTGFQPADTQASITRTE